MRISSSEPGAAENYAVFLDGKPLPLCFEADDTEGWADCCEQDSNGAPFIRDGELATVRVHGPIEIRGKY